MLNQKSYEPEEAPSKGPACICRQGGARVTTNTRLADLNLHNLRVDDRRIEVIANGLPIWGWKAVSTKSGEPRSRGGTYAGAAFQDARRNKERTSPELLHNRRRRLVVLGVEVGGRWSNEAFSFIRMLAKAKDRFKYLTPWSLLLLVSVLPTERCTNKICARWILCFAGCCCFFCLFFYPRSFLAARKSKPPGRDCFYTSQSPDVFWVGKV